MNTDLPKYRDLLPKQSPERFKLFYLGLAFTCLVVMLAISIYVIERHSHNALINYVEMNSERISDSIYYTEVEAISTDTYNGRSNIHISPNAFDYLDTRIRDKYDQLDILKVNIYNINKTIIYSSDKKSVGRIENSAYLEQSLEKGTLQTVYREHQSIVDLVGEHRENIDLAEVYVPIKQKSGQIIGAIAVFSDVASLKKDNREQLYSSIIILISSILIISLMSYLVIIRETSELKKAYRLLESLATTDSLTGVCNRRQVLSRASELYNMTCRTSGKVIEGVGMGFVMIDADHFKAVNDTHGHLTGDAVLCELAERTASILRQYDVFGRYGGEEFLLILPAVTPEEVKQIAERICTLVREKPMTADNAEIQLTVSIGALWTDAAQGSLDNVLSNVDKLLYQAKHQGRDQVAFST